jgi:hypothetical protein
MHHGCSPGVPLPHAPLLGRSLHARHPELEDRRRTVVSLEARGWKSLCIDEDGASSTPLPHVPRYMKLDSR